MENSHDQNLDMVWWWLKNAIKRSQQQTYFLQHAWNGIIKEISNLYVNNQNNQEHRQKSVLCTER
jgi:hypothetical protein